MAAFLDICRFNPTAGGLTDWTFSTAVVGCQSPAAAGAVIGATYSYRAESADLSQWEIGLGVWNGTALSRVTVLYNSAGTTAKINFAAAPQVAVVALSGDLLALRRKNYIINGAMMVSQENGTAAGTSNLYYPVDQFVMQYSNAGTQTAQQVASATPAGSPNRLRITVTAADTSVAAGDFLALITRMEGLRVADLRLGSASAKTVTVQFGVKAPAGTYCVVIRNGGSNDRTYVAEYTVTSGEANTAVVKSVTVALDQTGAWAADNTSGLEIVWSLMAGSTFQTAANAWTAGLFLASANQFNFMGTINNVFELFDVSLTEGSVAPAFQVPDFASELALCRRYFYNGAPPAIGICGGTTSAVRMTSLHPVTMRGAPTLALVGTPQVYDGSVVPNITSLGANNSTASVLQFDATLNASSTTGRPLIILPSGGGGITVNARL